VAAGVGEVAVAPYIFLFVGLWPLVSSLCVWLKRTSNGLEHLDQEADDGDITQAPRDPTLAFLFPCGFGSIIHLDVGTIS
jgi:hypothetical protein